VHELIDDAQVCVHRYAINRLFDGVLKCLAGLIGGHVKQACQKPCPARAMAHITGPEFNFTPGFDITVTFSIFAGPILSSFDDRLRKRLRRSTEFGSFLPVGGERLNQKNVKHGKRNYRLR
jgi:hypothetical protein